MQISSKSKNILINYLGRKNQEYYKLKIYHPQKKSKNSSKCDSNVNEILNSEKKKRIFLNVFLRL